MLIWAGETPTNPSFVPVVGSSPTNYHILNFTLNSLNMELDTWRLANFREIIRNRIAMSMV